MADKTGIEWCDATFNPWIGCEKVSPGCAHCYAETLVHGRMGRGGTWGSEGRRERTSPSNWKKPLRWAKLAGEGKLPDGRENPDGHRPRIFCASLADVFEERPELGPWRSELFELIAATPELDWLVLTKRPELAREFLFELDTASSIGGRFVTRDDPELFGWGCPFNVWLGVSIENARHTWRADVLREIPAGIRFLSCEPLLGSLYPRVEGIDPVRDRYDGVERVARNLERRAALDLTGIDWMIVGGESGRSARPMHLGWAREIIDACRQPDFRGAIQYHRQYGPAVFVKQLGVRPTEGAPSVAKPVVGITGKGGNWDEWPADLRIREFPTRAARGGAGVTLLSLAHGVDQRLAVGPIGDFGHRRHRAADVDHVTDRRDFLGDVAGGSDEGLAAATRLEHHLPRPHTGSLTGSLN